MDIREQFIDVVHSANALHREANRLAEIVETEAPGTLVHILTELAAIGVQPPPWLFGDQWTPYRALVTHGRARVHLAGGAVVVVPLWGRRLQVKGPVKVEVFDGKRWQPWGNEVADGFLSARFIVEQDAQIEIDIY